MKTLKYILIAAVAGGLFGASCTHKFEEYNTDPNRMVEGKAEPMSFLENIVFDGADLLLYRTYQINGELIQYTVSTTVSNAFHRFIVTNGNASNCWNELATAAANANEMIQLAQSKDRKECEAVGLTMRTLFLQSLTDMFGDIPCSEAFMGRDGNTMPRFDTQEEVYAQLLDDLERANELYAASGMSTLLYPNKDLLYGGDIAKWRKFNNSLYLRLLMRVSGRDAYLDVSKRLKAVVDAPDTWPVFTSNDDAAVMKFTGVTPNENRFGKVNSKSFTVTGRRACQNMADMMTPSKDPRYEIYFEPKGQGWSGLISGRAIKEDEGEDSTADYLRKSVLGDYTSWYAFMHYDEVLFILAEAAQRGLIGGGDAVAADYYTRAVEASVRYWGSQAAKQPDDAVIQDFLAKVTYDGSYKQLMEQKYIALFWCGYEGWNEYRRTGYPILTINEGTKNEHVVPRRFEYPNITRDTNLDNYRAALSRLQERYQGGDDMLTPVWWSKEGIRRYR